ARDVLEVEHEDLAVSDLVGTRGTDDRLGDANEQRIVDGHLELALRQKVDHVLRAAVELGVAFLAAEALALGDGEALDTDLGQCVAHVVELEWLDDGGDEFHWFAPVRAVPASAAAARTSS